MSNKEMPDRFDDEWFEQYLKGTLPEDKLEIFEERLLVDQEVRQRLDQTEAYMKAMRGALRRAQVELADEPVPFWSKLTGWVARPFPLMGGLAAAAVAVVILISLPRHPPQEKLGPPITVELHPMRGGTTEAMVPAGHIRMVLDTRGLSPQVYTVQVVTDQNKEIWQGPVTINGDSVTVDVPKTLYPGDYLAKLNAGTEQVREFGLTLR